MLIKWLGERLGYSCEGGSGVKGFIYVLMDLGFSSNRGSRTFLHSFWLGWRLGQQRWGLLLGVGCSWREDWGRCGGI